MIHSLAGGKLAELNYNDYVKVEIMEGENVGKRFWYKRGDVDIAVDDIVIVPLINKEVKARVIRIEYNLSSQLSPIPSNKTKYIISKL